MLAPPCKSFRFFYVAHILAFREPAVNDQFQKVKRTAPKDPEQYMDVSNAVVLGAPKAPAGKYFYGWEYAGNLYKKGDLITVLSQYAKNVDADHYQITLKAVYGAFSLCYDTIVMTKVTD